MFGQLFSSNAEQNEKNMAAPLGEKLLTLQIEERILNLLGWFQANEYSGRKR